MTSGTKAGVPGRGRNGVWSAPGRVNLIGEHTDYNYGFSLPLAIPHRTTVRATTRADGQVTAATDAPGLDPVSFGVDTAPGEIDGWGAYIAGAIWALRDAGHDVPGVDLAATSNVPNGAGLSSSAALECAVMVALNDLANLGLDATTLALLAQRSENHYVGAPTGVMDQMASMHGRAGHLVFLDFRDNAVDLVPCDLESAGLSLLIIDTQAPHRHVDGEYGARRATCEAAAAALGVGSLRDVQDHDVADVLARLDDDVSRRRVRHVLTENARTTETVSLLRSGRVREIGPLLTASHVSLRDDYEVTVPELDVAVDALLDVGALGARMTGGGFGGSVIALVDRTSEGDAGDAVREAFGKHEFKAPVTFTAVPSDGAGRS